MSKLKPSLIILFLLISCITQGAGIKAGIATRVITPPLPFWLSGYGSRTKPATEVLHDIWAKALVLEENPDSRIVIVTTDLLGISHEVAAAVADRVNKKHGIRRSQLLLSASHTHSGPAVWPSLSMIFDLNQADQQAAARYTLQLTDDIVAVIDSAMSCLAPMQLWSGHGTADFAMNRREPTAKGIINGRNPKGPVDHDVPLLKIATPEGVLKAVLFGYACHNTTSNTYLINGDYAGFAQLDLEKTYPGITAMFFMGCGADQNPQPRGSIELAMQHGKALSKAVQAALGGQLRAVHPPIRTAYRVTDLEFAPYQTENFRQDMPSNDKYIQRRAKLMLEAYNKGWEINHFPYPLQVIRFGKDLTILALSGEVVVDYALQTKKKYGNENLFVAGYCDEVMCYIPTKRILEEAGYEANESMIYYGLPGPFAPDVEDRISSAIKRLMRDVGAKPS